MASFCESCGSKLQANSAFCGECGGRVSNLCPTCGQVWNKAEFPKEPEDRTILKPIVKPPVPEIVSKSKKKELVNAKSTAATPPIYGDLFDLQNDCENCGAVGQKNKQCKTCSE